MPIISININNDAGDGYDVPGGGLSVTVTASATINGYVKGLNCAGDNFVFNYGAIDGAAGVSLGGGGNILVNAKSGVIAGSTGVYGSTTANTILNDGAIFGTANGVSVFGTFNRLINLGTIAGGFNSLNVNGGDGFVLVNRGLLEGPVWSISTNITIRNSGAIHGAVTLGGGTNLFNGRGGTVNGTITGGSGADTLIAGNDGETLNGAAGENALTGGAGADTFVFSALGAGNVDTIKGFAVAADTLEFQHSAFAALIAGKTPAFAIATHATSAGDHLFYNSANGNLYYDSNGSGAGGASLVANLGAGLKLTAHNFTVV